MIFAFLLAAAQGSTVPEAHAIVGARIVAGDGTVIEKGRVVVRDGRIEVVDASTEAPPDARVLDGAGLTVYPGWIDANVVAGIAPPPAPSEGPPRDTSAEAFARMRETFRKGIRPDVSATALLDVPEDVASARRQAGFALAVMTPPAATIGGRASLVELSGGARRDSIVRLDVSMAAALQPAAGDGYPVSTMGAVAHFRQSVLDAQWLRDAWRAERERPTGKLPPIDPVLAALEPVLDHGMPVAFETTTGREALRAIAVSDELGLRPWIVDGRGTHECAAALAAKQVPVFLSMDFGPEPKDPPARPASSVPASGPGGVVPASGPGGVVPASGPGGATSSAPASVPASAPAATKWLDPDELGPRARAERKRLWDERVSIAATLRKAGVQVALTTRGLAKASDFHDALAKCVEHGLSRDDALAAITSRPAEILGASAFLGRVAAGRPAYLTVVRGTIGDKDLKVRSVFVGSKRFDFDLEEPDKPAASKPASSPASAPASDVQAAASRAASAPALAKDEWPIELDPDRKPHLHTGGNVLLRDVTLLPVTAPMTEKTSILVRGGKIAAIAPGIAPPEGVAVVDGRGLFVLPGSVDCHSHIAIDGDVNEGSDSVTAECRIGDVLDPDDVSIYRALAGGSTVNRLLHGSANAIGGEHAVIKLKWKRTADELRMAGAPRGIKFALGENPKQSNFFGRRERPRRFPTSRMGVEAVIRRSLDEARDFVARKREDLDRIAKGEVVPPRRRDLRLETLAGIVEGEVAIHSHCYRADEILMLLDVAEEHGIRVKTLQHALEAYKVAPEIARHGAAVSTFSDWWAYKVEAYDATPYNAALLRKVGVSVSFNSDSAELVRRLHLDSAKAMRYGGLSADEALSLVTIEPARQLGIDARVGSVEVGKDADLAVFDGHPLSDFSKCVMTIVDGEVEFERLDRWADYVASLPTRAASPAARPSFAANTPWAAAPKVAPPPTEKIAIVHATVVPVSSEAFEDGTVVVDGGRIAALGRGLAAPAGYEVIDGTGLRVYPGMIDASTTLGLTEVGAVLSTNDLGEGSGFHPDVRASRAISAASEHIPVARAGGVTTAVVEPTSGLLRGQSALVHLDGWTPAEMALVDPLALHVGFPAQRASEPDKPEAENAKEREKQYRSSTKELREQLERAAAYARAKRGPRDPGLDALAPYALGERPVVFHVGAPRDAVGAVRFAEEMKLKPILAMGSQRAAQIAAFLTEHDVPVLLGAVTTLPSDRDDPYDTPFSAARVLHAAGVRFAFTTGSSSDVRNLSQ
ncbi:MAG TPA: amidohydrolase family protein, partial [Planctomycetota bacterium]|nr:amidohydrolase family protein [Planctomycetota bacterium]